MDDAAGRDSTPDGRPDAFTLAGFGIVVVLGGANFVAVKFSNEGLPPFFGAALRFLAASGILFAYMAFRRIPRPVKGQWTGTVLFGLLGIAAFYAFGYWGLLWLPTGVAAVLAASVPLLTLVLAAAQGVEKMTVRGSVGSAIAIGGIALMAGLQPQSTLSLAAVLAVLVAALSDAEAGKSPGQCR
jgi:drug/metabolite transporter (DMT)-like permease